jgi:hypothetical protein
VPTALPCLFALPGTPKTGVDRIAHRRQTWLNSYKHQLGWPFVFNSNVARENQPHRSAPSSRGGRSCLNAFWHDWLFRGCKRTFSPLNRWVVTTYALEVSATGEGDYRDHSFSAFRAARCLIHGALHCLIHGTLPISSTLTRNSNFCSSRACRVAP